MLVDTYLLGSDSEGGQWFVPLLKQTQTQYGDQMVEEKVFVIRKDKPSGYWNGQEAFGGKDSYTADDEEVKQAWTKVADVLQANQDAGPVVVVWTLGILPKPKEEWNPPLPAQTRPPVGCDLALGPQKDAQRKFAGCVAETSQSAKCVDCGSFQP